MTTATAVGAVSSDAAEWYAINWPTIHRNVRRLQVRIVQCAHGIAKLIYDWKNGGSDARTGVTEHSDENERDVFIRGKRQGFVTTPSPDGSSRRMTIRTAKLRTNVSESVVVCGCNCTRLEESARGCDFSVELSKDR